MKGDVTLICTPVVCVSVQKVSSRREKKLCCDVKNPPQATTCKLLRLDPLAAAYTHLSSCRLQQLPNIASEKKKPGISFDVISP
mmetsp:Transcript_7446/g.10962  ORF Transcript_7446/g.10962 Transcript_7446/m.10962 type:complete len:84 (+) Transcript_7446:2124-2375(+)